MSSRSLNKVMLIGNLTRDPELRYTPQGTPVCTFGLATNRSWVPAAGGERQEETEFHRIVSWQKLAELCSQLLFKGRKVYVEGRLQTRTWTGADGQERTTTEIVIDSMIVLDSKRRPGEEMMEQEVGMAPAISPAATTSTSASDMPATGDDTDMPDLTSQDTSFGGAKKTAEKKATQKTSTSSAKKADKADKVEGKSEGTERGKKVAKKGKEEEVKADDIPF